MVDTAEFPAMVMGLDDPRLPHAMDVNIVESLAIASENIGGEVYRGPELTRYISGLPMAFFNGVALTQLPAGHEDAVIEETLTRFQEHGLPMIWWDGPGMVPADLRARLVAHGVRRGGEMPGMAVEISALGPLRELPGVTIARVNDLSTLEAWARTSAVGFGAPVEAASVFFNMFKNEVVAPGSPWLVHLAMLYGEPVATSMTLFNSGVAGVFNVATLPQARGRGIGGEITRAGLLEAGARGYRVGVLQASSMGYRVYRRLGFETVFMYHDHYWAPTTADGAGQE